MVKIKQELKLIHQNADFDARIEEFCKSSKLQIKIIKDKISNLEAAKDQVELEQLSSSKAAEEQKIVSRQLAFQRSAKEIEAMYVKINTLYTAPATALTRAAMLKRNADKSALAAEFDKFRNRVDKLIDTECDRLSFPFGSFLVFVLGFRSMYIFIHVYQFSNSLPFR